jgi:CheY-like chemotaxis protein
MAAERAITTYVLLIEPDHGLASALEASLTANHGLIHTVAGAPEALELLGRPSRPDLIILDADMPDGAGFGVLRTIKESNELRHIPTIVFVGGSDASAVDEAWDLGANCVIRKPERREEFEPVFPRLSRFWLAAAVLPRRLQAWAARR